MDVEMIASDVDTSFMLDVVVSLQCRPTSVISEDTFQAERIYPGILHPDLVRLTLGLRTTHEGADGLSSEPTVFENYVHDIHVDDQTIELSLWDTAGEFRL